jgi:hypothetical protein
MFGVRDIWKEKGLNSSHLNTIVYLWVLKTGSKKPPKFNFHLLLNSLRDFHWISGNEWCHRQKYAYISCQLTAHFVVKGNTGKAGNFEPVCCLPTDTQTTAKISSYTHEKAFYLRVVPYWVLPKLTSLTEHFNIIPRKSNKKQQCVKILFYIYMKLNMFRATHRPAV